MSVEAPNADRIRATEAVSSLEEAEDLIELFHHGWDGETGVELDSFTTSWEREVDRFVESPDPAMRGIGWYLRGQSEFYWRTEFKDSYCYREAGDAFEEADLPALAIQSRIRQMERTGGEAFSLKRGRKKTEPVLDATIRYLGQHWVDLEDERYFDFIDRLSSRKGELLDSNYILNRTGPYVVEYAARKAKEVGISKGDLPLHEILSSYVE